MSKSESSRVKDRTTGRFRCLYCFTRVKPPSGAATYTCGTCGYAWRIWWFSPTEPRIRGPVWDQHEKLSREIMKKQGD
ncbi:MAG: hypothetical protein R6V41_10995 [Desulfobacteraceae bacterium]